MSIQVTTHLELMRDSSKAFPIVMDKSAIRTAWIWHCGYRSLFPISEMTNIEELVIGTLPDASLDMLSKLPRLRHLRIVHMPKITSLEVLERLPDIEILSLSTSPSWDASRKCTFVDSLAPIVKLPKLRQLELFGICPPDKSLRELLLCPNLESARFSQYPKDEVDDFYQRTGIADAYASEASFQ